MRSSTTLLPTHRLRRLPVLHQSQRRITIHIPTGSRHPPERVPGILTRASIVLQRMQFLLRQGLRLPRSHTDILRHQGHRPGPSHIRPELMRM